MIKRKHNWCILSWKHAGKSQSHFQNPKNRWNGQSIAIKSDKSRPDICPVKRCTQNFCASWSPWSIWIRTVSCFPQLVQPKKYLAHSNIAEILQSVARSVHPGMSRDKISYFSSHSERVWALVLLDEAGMSPEFVQFQLHWLGESNRLFLCGTYQSYNKSTWVP